MLNYFKDSASDGIVPTFKDVWHGRPITFQQYELLCKGVFDVGFMEHCEKYFQEHVYGTPHKFTVINVDMLRTEFLTLCIQSLVEGVMR
jgi:hypothetical protein